MMESVDVSGSNIESRNFKEINVGCFSSQTWQDRFPGSRQRGGRPRLSQWRNSLTALSQIHNLYFAAVEDRIHVIVPRNVKQTLPGTPDIEIVLPMSVEAVGIGGVINPSHGHCVNHLIIGNLGDDEIVLVSCDDGDVLAYYTNVINEAVERIKYNHIHYSVSEDIEASLGSSQTSAEYPLDRSVKHMFHENVGKSAWGLAIHAKSRLIAVSANNYEVSVFAFGLRSRSEDEENEIAMEAMETGTRLNKELFKPRRYRRYPRRALDDRRYGRRLIYPASPPESPLRENVPTVAFVSDETGEASRLLAGDTSGCLWMMDLDWEKRLEFVGRHAADIGEMVWGILVIPVKDFLLQPTPQEAIGMPCLDNALAGVQIDNAIAGGQIHQSISGYLDVSSTVTDICDPKMRERKNILAKELRKEAESFCSLMRSTVNKNLSLEGLPFLRFREPELVTQEDIDMDARKNILPDGSAILRTFKHDIELIPPTKGILRTVLEGIMSHPLRNPPHRPIDPINIAMDRMNLLQYIQPLSLVVVGSQKGDVALLTLTRMPDECSNRGPVTTFRLDHLLPFKDHIQQTRPPLVGLASSPVPGAKGRWRLILHYLDHSILSYELWRGERGDLLLI